MAMASKRSLLLLAAANLLIPAAILVFATGFFPYKPFLSGKATFKADDVRNAPFDKVVFMVVDALRRLKVLHPPLTIADLRSDFVYSPNSGFAFTQEFVPRSEKFW